MSLVPLSSVEIAVGYPREGRDTEFQTFEMTDLDGQYRYDTLGPVRPSIELLRFRRMGYTELVRRMSDAAQGLGIDYRLDVTLLSEGAPASPVLLEVLEGGVAFGPGEILLFVRLRFVELVGVGGNLNSLRFIRARPGGGVVDMRELGAEGIISQTGSNRLEAGDERDEFFYVTTSSGPPSRQERVDVILSYTDDRGIDSTAVASFIL